MVYILKITIMKTLFTIVLLCISTLLWGQNYTQKYNELYDRTEFYNSYGNLIGYAKYNSLKFPTP